MARGALCLSFAFLLLANVIPSEAQSAEPAAAPAADPVDVADASPAAGLLPDILYDVRSNITLQCPLPNDKNLDYVWKKNDTELSLVWEMTGRWSLERGGVELHVPRALEDDWGNYSCGVAGNEHRWAVRGRPHVKLPANANVVEGQKLKLTCRVVGKPHPRVTWLYSNSSDGPFAPLDAASGATLADSDAGVPDGVLLLPSAARSHAGRYNCTARDAPVPATTTLRVKDMYAALWPFLGICAEVFVLCAVILLYERRRTKPDLDDSDADNHDQKKS